MKTIQSILVVLFLTLAIKGQAQTQEKLPPPPPPPKASVKKFPPPKVIGENSQRSEKLFLKQNPAVSKVAWKNSNRIIIGLKDGTKETYNLNSPGDKNLFTSKYGVSPIAPPPPPRPKVP